MPYVPRNLRVEFYSKVCKCLPWGAYSDCSFMNHTSYGRIKGIYAILVIRLKQSKSLHLIQQDSGCVKHATNLRIYLCLALGNMKNSFESFIVTPSDSKLSKNFRTSNFPLKD